jgi:hypothetical protein
VEDRKAMEPVEGIQAVALERFQLTCSVCRTRDGACIRCSFGTCATRFHPMCAFLSEERRMEISTVDGEGWGEHGCYCVKHSNRNGGN